MKPLYYIIGTGLIGVLYLFYYYNPSQEVFFPKCPFYSLTGLYCPGCGSQRALHQLVHFNFLKTIDYNALYPIGMLAITYNLILKGINRYSKTEMYNYLYHPKTPIIIGIIVVLFWVLRNIPIQPFCHLAP